MNNDLNLVYTNALEDVTNLVKSLQRLDPKIVRDSHTYDLIDLKREVANLVTKNKQLVDKINVLKKQQQMQYKKGYKQGKQEAKAEILDKLAEKPKIVKTASKPEIQSKPNLLEQVSHDESEILSSINNLFSEQTLPKNKVNEKLLDNNNNNAEKEVIAPAQSSIKDEPKENHVNNTALVQDTPTKPKPAHYQTMSAPQQNNTIKTNVRPLSVTDNVLPNAIVTDQPKPKQPVTAKSQAKLPMKFNEIKAQKLVRAAEEITDNFDPENFNLTENEYNDFGTQIKHLQTNLQTYKNSNETRRLQLQSRLQGACNRLYLFMKKMQEVVTLDDELESTLNAWTKN